MFTSRLQQLKRRKTDLHLISLVKKYGIPRSQVEEITQEFANRIPEKGVNYYYYIGPNDAKTRSFCKLMLKIDKVFTEEEIQYMSDELGYPVIEYCGSYGCRHGWVKFRGRVITTPKPTQREIRRLLNEGLEVK